MRFSWGGSHRHCWHRMRSLERRDERHGSHLPLVLMERVVEEQCCHCEDKRFVLVGESLSDQCRTCPKSGPECRERRVYSGSIGTEYLLCSAWEAHPYGLWSRRV